jgi:hypothetical protein
MFFREGEIDDDSVNSYAGDDCFPLDSLTDSYSSTSTGMEGDAEEQIQDLFHSANSEWDEVNLLEDPFNNNALSPTTTWDATITFDNIMRSSASTTTTPLDENMESTTPATTTPSDLSLGSLAYGTATPSNLSLGSSTTYATATPSVENLGSFNNPSSAVVKNETHSLLTKPPSLFYLPLVPPFFHYPVVYFDKSLPNNRTLPCHSTKVGGGVCSQNLSNGSSDIVKRRKDRLCKCRECLGDRPTDTREEFCSKKCKTRKGNYMKDRLNIHPEKLHSRCVLERLIEMGASDDEQERKKEELSELYPMFIRKIGGARKCGKK